MPVRPTRDEAPLGSTVTTRREVLRSTVGVASLAALGCAAEARSPGAAASTASRVLRRGLDVLPATDLGWLSLRDHFVATVGPHAGSGSPLGGLVVLADATFAPRSRFPLHPHREIEILSVVLDGELSHHGDSENGATLRAREAQLISSRSGMFHAEGNDTDAPTRMLQIWFEPDVHGGDTAYFKRTLGASPRAGGRQQIAGDADMPLRGGATVWWIDLAPGREETLTLAPGRAGYLLATSGTLEIGDARLSDGEGAELRGGTLVARSEAPATAIFIDVPV